VRTSDVVRLFDAPGPFLSIYLATERGVENAAFRLATKWKTLRGDLLEAGTPEGTLQAVDPLIEGSHSAGATLAVIAAADGVVYYGSLPYPLPRQSLVRHGSLPYVLPLLSWSQSLVPHVAVLASRAHAELAARVPDGVGRTVPRIGAAQDPVILRPGSSPQSDRNGSPGTPRSLPESGSQRRKQRSPPTNAVPTPPSPPFRPRPSDPCAARPPNSSSAGSTHVSPPPRSAPC